jgi:hypothetical protein
LFLNKYLAVASKKLRRGLCDMVFSLTTNRYWYWLAGCKAKKTTPLRPLALWLGWAYLTKKVPRAATMPIVTAVVCFLSTQNMGS